MFTLTSLMLRSSAIRWRMGSTAWHGPHHSAQKSTSTGSSACRTSVSKVVSVTSFAIVSFRCSIRVEPVLPSSKDGTPQPRLAFPMRKPIFQPLPDKPDHPGLEQEMLARWDAEGTFAKLREQNSGGPSFSFFDGPVTANRFSLGVHTAWGRTLKDVFQRYKALRGFDQRYQNGFDCQGLWIEVGVERELGPQLEARDRGVRPRGVRAPLPRRRRPLVGGADARLEAARPVDGLGQRLLHLQRHEHRVHLALPEVVHERGWLYMGHRSTEWCPRCGTSISQHELTRPASTSDRADPSLYVRLPLLDRPGESLVVWTTTPWTLPANVAAAVNPEPEYGRRENGEWVAAARYPDEQFARPAPGAELVGLALPRAVRRPHARRGGRAPRHPVGRGLARGGHRASSTSRPAAAREDFELAAVHGLPVLTPVDEAGRFYDDYGWLHGLSTAEAAEQIIGDLAREGFLVEAGLLRAPLPALLALRHAADLPDRRRLVHLRRRAPAAAARRERDGRVDARVHGQAHGRLAAQHGRLEHLAPALLRPAAAVLPLRVRAPERDRVARRARGARASRGSTSSRSCAGRGSTACRSAARSAASRSSAIKEVGDVWLDAGIVPFSTLGWQNPEWVAERLRDRAPRRG